MSLPSRCAERPAAALTIGGAIRPHVVANPFQLVDLQRRRVEYLRLSVTDRCNYRCSYCMPAEGVHVVPRADLLDFDEMTTLTRLFVQLGVRRVRLTGGEPLVRRGIVDLVKQIAAIPGVDDLAMTTNGHLLAELAEPLKQAGLQRLNVSLDTLDPKKFAHVSRGGALQPVLDGIAAAQRAGFASIKLNAVTLKGLNDHELLPLCDFAARQNLVLRLIEYMPIGVDAFWGPETWQPVAETRTRVMGAYALEPDESGEIPGGGPARYWRGRNKLSGRELRVGFISAVSEKFCEACNRVRLSPTGTLRECLSTRGALSLRDMLRAGASEAELMAAIHDAMAGKVDGHRYDAAVPTLESMSAIGG